MTRVASRGSAGTGNWEGQSSSLGSWDASSLGTILHTTFPVSEKNKVRKVRALWSFVTSLILDDENEEGEW